MEEECIRFDSLRNATIFIHLIGLSERGVCAPAAVQTNTQTQAVTECLCVCGCVCVRNT